MTTQTVTIRRTLQASCEEVFDAWLDAEGMPLWMCPGPVTASEVELDPRVGGRFQIVMIAAQARFVNTGEFLVLDRPSRLQFTWISSRWDQQETLVTIELRPRGGQCELILTHERFPETHSSAQLTAGWTSILENLQLHLESGPRLRP
ncbi:SRPBCC family protein [Paludibaculum fermentans]|uniref:SRPBCC family protein n=1 Tax=Paludibaculum fermentans TaxID=1473598 RepID=UPI003EBC3085